MNKIVKLDSRATLMYRSFYLKRKWVYESFTECLISLAIQKRGEWVVVPPSEMKEVYDMLVKKPEKELTDSEKEFRTAQMKNVLQAKSNKRKRIEKKLERQATHLVFRKTNNTTLEKWVEDTLRVRDIRQYKSKADKGCFFALTEGGPMEGEIVSSDWVKENFHIGYINMLVATQGIWLQVPVGAARDNKYESSAEQERQGAKRQKQKRQTQNGATKTKMELAGVSKATFDGREVLKIDKMLKDWPEIRFRQGSRDTCMFSSVASALFFMGLRRTASMLHDQAARSTRKHLNGEKVKLMEEVFAKHEPWLIASGERKEYKSGLLRREDYISDQLTMVVLGCIDGSRNHAVAFFDHWVFDSNETHAMPICDESLNRAAPPGFDKIVWAVRYAKKKK